ncbi:ATP-binding protein [Microvirga sp. ACRRW]|uniref:AlbA family DNA-binding domain-containing protein n=1 Tax=Microvirga sp. ACRRW TaxID=2918205 RepID=UPI001EF65CDA|nr:ATP-binding protein [Microvirga sp. ACRRW]MCG7392958.1 ATP-binding protein [Microvirga sp. ACRRW]
MLAKPIDDIDLSDLHDLIGIAEGRQMEFKRDHYGRTDEARREFAADVSALANSVGGDLLIGIEESKGVASSIPGVEASDPDALVRGIEQALSASFEPPIIGIRIRWIAVGDGKGVILIRVPRSRGAPHRVTAARDNRFFARDENGKHPMNVSELRRAFLLAAEVEQRIRGFRAERLELLAANEGPLAVAEDGPRLICHVVPEASFTDGLRIAFAHHDVGVPPFDASGYNSLRSMDGFVTYSGPEEKFESVRAFTTLFHNGIVESVARIPSYEENGSARISINGIEDTLIHAMARTLPDLKRRSIPMPLYIIVSLLDVRGTRVGSRQWEAIAYPYRRPNLLLPELLVEDADDHSAQGIATLLRPLFDLLWNAFGRHGSPNYNGEGRYEARN